MTKLYFSRYLFLSLVLCLLFVLGCASTGSSRFYTLSSLQKAETELRGSTTDRRLTIGIGPIKFAEYLDRPEIVTRSNSNKIELSEFDLWAGSLAEDFSRVLAENLSILLSTEQIIVYPGVKALPLDYQILMDVIRFDGSLGGEVTLIVRWVIVKGKEKKSVLIRKSSIIEPSGAKGYEDLVRAQSRTMEKLSHEIAEAIISFPQ